jgi:hypothetical protein
MRSRPYSCPFGPTRTNTASCRRFQRCIGIRVVDARASRQRTLISRRRRRRRPRRGAVSPVSDIRNRPVSGRHGGAESEGCRKSEDSPAHALILTPGEWDKVGS